MSKRSIKIDGHTTSLFLEDTFWREIEIRASSAHLTPSQYLRDILSSVGPEGNRSAAIKEYLMSQLRSENARATDHIATSTPLSKWLVESRGKADRFEFSKRVIRVGRSRASDLTLADPEVQTHHAMLVYDGERWWGVDLNTPNGMKLNNKAVLVAALPRRSELQIGNSQIIKI